MNSKPIEHLRRQRHKMAYAPQLALGYIELVTFKAVEQCFLARRLVADSATVTHSRLGKMKVPVSTK